MYSQSSVFFVFFFFSSRRRHTRLQGDWSSDVCSSDLLRSSWAFPGAKKDSVAMTNARMAGPILRRLRAEAAKGVDSGPPRACSLTRGLQDAVGSDSMDEFNRRLPEKSQPTELDDMQARSRVKVGGVKEVTVLWAAYPRVLKKSLSAARSIAQGRETPAGSFAVVLGREVAISTALGFVLLVHVPDRRFHDQEIGLVRAMDFNAVLVVPLDDSVNSFAGVEDDDHRRAGLHLLDIVEILRVRLLRWSRFLPLQARAHLVLDFRQRWTDQFSVHSFTLLTPHPPGLGDLGLQSRQEIGRASCRERV